jgi:hypothetical protein
VTAADVQDPAAGATPAATTRAALAPLRMAWLFAVSRRVPVALGLLLALGALLWCALHWRWNIAGGPAAQEVIPLTVEAGSACIIAVSTYGPFGETEQATGRWLPYLRLGAALILSAAAFGALAAGGSAGALPGGAGALLRDLAGFAGLGLLSAAALGGAFGWTGPLAYLLVTEVALTGNPTTPWVWAGRPPADLGAALCAAVVFGAGVGAVAVLGTQGVRRSNDHADVLVRLCTRMYNCWHDVDDGFGGAGGATRAADPGRGRRGSDDYPARAAGGRPDQPGLTAQPPGGRSAGRCGSPAPTGRGSGGHSAARRGRPERRAGRGTDQ